MQLAPALDYRRVLKKGMRGTDVAALQINLPVAIDGVFGPKTLRAVKGAQGRLDITKDGIAGLITQRAMVLDLSRAASEASGLPWGLIESLVANESGFALAAFSWHPADEDGHIDGYDLGAFQTSITADRSQPTLVNAYDVMTASTRYSGALKKAAHAFGGAIDSPYRTAMGGTDKTYRWMLAALSHNWPYAADNIATIGRIFIEQGRDDRDEEWIIDVTEGRLRTAREWVISYVERATALIDWETV